MPAVQNMIVVGFTEPSKAYQALSVLKERAAEGRIGLDAAAIVERTSDGHAAHPGEHGQRRPRRHGERLADRDARRRPRRSGRSPARLGRRCADRRSVRPRPRRSTSDEALRALGQAMAPESTAVIANVSELAVEVIDGDMAKLGGEVTRRPVAEVMDQLEAAEDAPAKPPRGKPDAHMHDKRKAQLSASFDDRVGKLKEKLHVS